MAIVSEVQWANAVVLPTATRQDYSSWGEAIGIGKFSGEVESTIQSGGEPLSGAIHIQETRRVDSLDESVVIRGTLDAFHAAFIFDWWLDPETGFPLRHARKVGLEGVIPPGMGPSTVQLLLDEAGTISVGSADPDELPAEPTPRPAVATCDIVVDMARP